MPDDTAVDATSEKELVRERELLIFFGYYEHEIGIMKLELMIVLRLGKCVMLMVEWVMHPKL